MTAKLVIVLTVCFFALLNPALGQNNSCADGTAMNCKSCALEPSNAFNIVPTLPRIDRNGKAISSNLGDYALFKQYDSCNGSMCWFVPQEYSDDSSLAKDQMKDGSYPPDSILHYAETYAMYFVLPILAFLLCIFTFAFLVFFRYCCCCVTGGTCGKRYPTQKTCLMGFKKEPEDPKDPKIYKYSACGRWCCKVYMFIFVICVFGLIGVGEVKGNVGLTDSFKSLAYAPQGVVDIGANLLNPVENFVEAAVGQSLVQFLRDANETVLKHVDLPRIQKNVDCLENTLDGLPQMSEIRGLLDQVNMSDPRMSSPVVYPTIGVEVLKLNQSRYDILDMVPRLNTTLYDGKQTLDEFNATVDSTVEHLDDLEADVSRLRPYPSQISGGLSKFEALPSSAEIATITDDLGTLGTSSYAERQDLKSRLTSTRTKVADLPDPDTFADTLVSFNETMDTFKENKTLDATLADLISMNTTVYKLPTAASFNASINDMTAVADINLDPVLDVLDVLNTSLNYLPEPSDFMDLLGRLDVILDIVPCAFDVVDILDDVNANVVKLMDDLDEIGDTVVDVNETLVESLDSFKDFNETFVDIDETLNDLNLTSTYADVESMQEDQSKVNSSQLDTLRDQLSDLDGKKAQVRILVPQVQSAKDLLNDPDTSVDSTLVTNVRTFQQPVADIPTQVDAAVLAIRVWESGFCVGDVVTSAVRCIANCGYGAGCTIAPADPTFGGDTWSDCATFAGNCDMTQAANPSTTPDFSALTTDLTDLKTSMDAQPDTGDLSANLDSLDATLYDMDFSDQRNNITDFQDSMPTDLEDHRQNLLSLMSVVQPLDTDSIVDNWNSLDEALETLKVADWKKQVNDVDEQITTVREDVIDRVDKYLVKLDVFVHVDLYRHLERLGAANLGPILRGPRGLERGMDEILTVVKEIYDWAMDLMDSEDRFDKADMMDQMETAFNFTNVLQDPEAMNNGPLYALLKIADAMGNGVLDDNATLLDMGNKTLDRVFTDANGKDYANDSLCMTDACVNNTIDFYNRDSLMTATDGSVPIPLSRELLTSAPFLLPAIVALLGLCGACCCGKSWQKWPTCCSVLLMFAMMPFILLICGVIEFPILMVISDVCEGMQDVGHQFFVVNDQYICNQTGGVFEYVNRTCSIKITNVEDKTMSVVFSPLKVYEAVMGDCSVTPDPVKQLFDSLSANVTTLPDDFVSGPIDDLKGKTGEIRPPLRAVVDVFTSGIGKNASNFVNDFGDVFTCQRLHNVIFKVKDSVCCHFFGSLFYLLGSWYMIGWSMFLCGCCAGIFGCKRFPSQANGSGAKRALEAYKKQREVPPMPTIPVVNEATNPLTDASEEEETRPRATVVAAPTTPAFGTSVAEPQGGNAGKGVPAVLSGNYEMRGFGQASVVAPPSGGMSSYRGDAPRVKKVPPKW